MHLRCWTRAGSRVRSSAVSSPTDLDGLFAEPGTFVDPDGHRMDVRIERMAPITLDGVAIGDPLAGSMAEIHPPKGRIRRTGAVVELAVTAFDNDDERVAAARVRFTERAVVSWVETEHGVAVDTGVAAIATAAALARLETEEGGDEVMRALDETYRDTWSAARVELKGAEMCAFSSGFGDGAYPAWWGIDAEGHAAALVLDFEVLKVPVFDELSIARPTGRGRVAAPEATARGIELGVPWLSSSFLEIAAGALPKDHYAVFRFRRPGSAIYELAKHQPVGDARRRTFRIDLREVPTDAQMFVRIVTGYRFAPRAPSDRAPFR